MSGSSSREQMVACLMKSIVPAAEWLSGLEKSIAELEPPPLDGRPVIVLPGDGKALSAFSSEIGEKLKIQKIYKRDGIALYVSDGHKLEPMGAKSFVTWLEQFIRVQKWAGTGAARRR